MAGCPLITESDRPVDSTHEGVATVCELGGVAHHHFEAIHLQMVDNAACEKKTNIKRGKEEGSRISSKYKTTKTTTTSH